MLNHAQPIIDATIFMAMHDVDLETRNSAISFFTNNFEKGVQLSLDQIGLCDALIWKKTRQEQDDYYPFMDVLHSIMPITRFSYSREIIDFALENSLFDGLNVPEACVAGYVAQNKATLYTLNHKLVNHPLLKGLIGNLDLKENAASNYMFNNELDFLYEKSLCLTVTTEEVLNAA